MLHVPSRVTLVHQRGVVLLLIVALLVSAASVALVAPRGVAAAGTATTLDALNLRSGPSVDDSVLDVVPGGATVTITGDAQNGYYPVAYNGEDGWVFGAFLDSGASAASGYEAVVTTDALNLRAGASTDSQILDVMPYGTVVTLTGQSSNGFVSVSYNGTAGWAYGIYVNGPVSGSGPSSGDTSGNGTSSSGDTSGNTNTTPPPDSGSTDIVSIIYAAADRYGQPRADMLRVAECESNLDPNAVNPISGASGLFQFLPSTWATTPYANDNIFDPWASANAAGWMWSVGRRGEWACQ